MKPVLVLLACTLHFGATSMLAQANRSVWDGVYTETQASSGEREYVTSCASCHGADLAGGEMAPGLTGGDFKSNWNTLTLQDLMDRMNRTMPLNAPQSLSRQQDAAILAYVLKKGGYPAGDSPLPTDSQLLGAIAFVADKP